MKMKKLFCDPVDPDEVTERMIKAMANAEDELKDVPKLFTEAMEDVEDDGAMGVTPTEPAPPMAKWAKK